MIVNEERMASEKQLIQLSKFLSLVLRHKPETIGIQPDLQGWVSIDELIEKTNKQGIPIDRDTLFHIVETNTKKRFALNETRDKIRASQGHSIEVELGYTNQEPPAVLYHGTGEQSVSSILQNGLEKRSRQHVHLSKDRETAIHVGQRHGKPFVFTVIAGKMYADGYSFYLSDNGVWLTTHVPPEYLTKTDI